MKHHNTWTIGENSTESATADVRHEEGGRSLNKEQITPEG